MHRLILSFLLLSATTMAAETLSNSKLESAYTPEEPACLASKGKKLPKNCDAASGSRVITDKALRDAEQQNTNNALGNPQLNNPAIILQPTEIPAPTQREQSDVRMQNGTTPAPHFCNGVFC